MDDKEYTWFKNGHMIVKSWDIERMQHIGPTITQEYFDDYIAIHKHHKDSLSLYYNDHIVDLGKLEKVDGDLYLKYTRIGDLGKLETVGGDLDLDSTEITTLDKLKSVGGFLDLNNCSNITSLGKLEKVGGGMDLEKTNMTSLGNLKSVGGKIYCTEGSDAHKLLMNSKFKHLVYP